MFSHEKKLQKSAIDNTMEELVERLEKMKIQFENNLTEQAKAHANLKSENLEKHKLFEAHMKVDPLP